MEVVLCLMQKVVEFVQTLARHLAVECAIRANISHFDICVHCINLERTKDTSGCLGTQHSYYLPNGYLPKYVLTSLCTLNPLSWRIDRKE